MVNRWLRYALIAVVSTWLLFGLNVPKAQAVEATGQSQGMTISPVLVELNGDPGKSYKIKLTVTNATTSDLVFTSNVNDFTSKDETGAPSILLEGQLPPSLSLKNWVSPIAPIRLNAKQSQSIEATINIPANAEPGGRYGVIRFSGRSPEEDPNSVALKASAGTLVLVRVSGEATEGLKLTDFYAEQNGKQSSWFEYGPITLVEKITNTGNVHVKPKGTAVIKDWLGKTVDTLEVNSENGNILPDGTRKFDQQLSKKWLFGKYTATLNLAYGSTGQVLQGQMSFWVIPWKIILGAIALLVITFLLLRWLIRRYNARIIRKAHAKGTPKSKK